MQITQYFSPLPESSQNLICWDDPGLLKDLHFAGLCLA